MIIIFLSYWGIFLAVHFCIDFIQIKAMVNWPVTRCQKTLTRLTLSVKIVNFKFETQWKTYILQPLVLVKKHKKPQIVWKLSAYFFLCYMNVNLMLMAHWLTTSAWCLDTFLTRKVWQWRPLSRLITRICRLVI